MNKAILGKKIGMTQIFLEDGRLVPVTVVEAGPCVVTQIKTKATDGYEAVQVGFGELAEQRAKKLKNKPELGHFAKAGVSATRYLRGGGPTFERIVSNLRDLKIPFRVNIRHNVHEGNKHEVDNLSAFIEKLAEESGNNLVYYPAPVTGSDAADARGKEVGLLCDSDASDIGVRQEAERFSVGRGHYCGAHSMWSVGIDDYGNLQKCWEAVDKPQFSFGTAHDWDPKDPLASASKADNLTMYLNTASPVPDDECTECVWLPMCVGGCPHWRITNKRRCIAFKDDPEAYVLALHARIGEDKANEDGASENGEAAEEAAQ